jgi:transposase
MQRELEAARMRNVQLDAEVTALKAELAEVLAQYELQKADLERYKAVVEASAPHRPERTVDDQLQLGWERILLHLANDQRDETGQATEEKLREMEPPGTPRDEERDRKRHSHGRRPPPELDKMPLKLVEIDPPEVLAAGGEGYCLIGVETSSRVGLRRGGYIHLKVVRRKWARIDDDAEIDLSSAGLADQALPPVVVADLPECLWPRFMADPSAIANVIVTKYGDVVPLNRQETISERTGFSLARSTLCNWLREAHRVLYRVVDAMIAEARAKAFCIATDATGAPIKSKGGCDAWHVFVLIADRDHVIFRHTPNHDGAAVVDMLEGFKGCLLADASSIYDILYRDHGLTECGCWSHQRRYFWKAIETEPHLAYEALALISQLFAVERDCKGLSLEEIARERAARAGPILDAMDRWVEQHRDAADPGGRIRAAVTYYDNQREALRAFLKDPRLPIHNNFSEQQLRNLVLGRANWMYFANEAGLSWYCVFRSLIASCGLHGLNPQLYLEEVLRLAPHWPTSRMLELAPKYWARTRDQLDARQRAIIAGPWELESQLVTPSRTSVVAA